MLLYTSDLTKHDNSNARNHFINKCFSGTANPRVRVHSFLLLCPCVDQHCLSGQSSFHPSLRDHVPAPIVSPLWIHRLQLLVALNNAVQSPQLVAKAFTLLRQDVDLFNRSAINGTSTVTVGD